MVVFSFLYLAFPLERTCRSKRQLRYTIQQHPPPSAITQGNLHLSFWLWCKKAAPTILPTAWHPQARTSSCCWPLLRPEVLWLTRSNHWNKHALATVRRLLKLSPSRPKLRVRKMFPPSDDGCYIIILLSPYQIDDDDMGKYLSLSLALVCLSFARCAFRSESVEYTHPPIDMIDPVTQ